MAIKKKAQPDMHRIARDVLLAANKVADQDKRRQKSKLLTSKQKWYTGLKADPERYAKYRATRRVYRKRLVAEGRCPVCRQFKKRVNKKC